MKKRIISGAIMIALTSVLLYVGDVFYTSAIVALALLSVNELISIKKDFEIPNLMKCILYICTTLVVLSNIGEYSIIFGLNYKILSLVLLLLLIPTIFMTKEKYTINDAFYIIATCLFIGTVFNLSIMIYNESVKYIIYILLIASITDTFALVGGKLIGKRKFTKISPNKTIEGSITGSFIGVIVSTCYYVTYISDSNILKTVFITLILSIIGQIGDLLFSLIKRENDVKDFSNMIPGHGGILDRLDSIIFIIIAFVFIMQFV